MNKKLIAFLTVFAALFISVVAGAQPVFPTGIQRVAHDTTMSGSGTTTNNLGVNVSCGAGSAVQSATGGVVSCITAGGTTTGTGTTNTLAMWTGTSTLGDSPLLYNGTTTLSTAKDFTVTGTTTLGSFVGTVETVATAGTIDNLPLGATTTVLRLTAATLLNGVNGGVSGRMLTIFNDSGATLPIVNEAGTSAVGSRFALASGVALRIAPYGTASCFYDGTGTRWRCEDDYILTQLSTTGSATIGNALTVTSGALTVSSGFISGTFGGGGAAAQFVYNGTAQVADRYSTYAINSATLDATAAGRIAYGVYSTVNASRSAGANNVTDIALYGTATGGQVNYALKTDDGDVWLNATSGTTKISGAATLSSTLNVTGLSTLAGTVITGSLGDAVNITHNATAQVVSRNGVLLTDSTTYDTTAGVITGYGLKVVGTGARSAGANNLTNVGIYSTVSGGQVNYALKTDDGDVWLNATSGTTKISGAATFSGNVTMGTSTALLSVKSGHISGGTTIAVGTLTCGTSPAIIGTDLAFEVTIGTGSPASCTIPFNVTWSSKPTCVISNQNGTIGFTYTTSTTNVVISGDGVSGHVYDVICHN